MINYALIISINHYPTVVIPNDLEKSVYQQLRTFSKEYKIDITRLSAKSVEYRGFDEIEALFNLLPPENEHCYFQTSKRFDGTKVYWEIVCICKDGDKRSIIKQGDTLSEAIRAMLDVLQIDHSTIKSSSKSEGK